jgi:hypothetical protein
MIIKVYGSKHAQEEFYMKSSWVQLVVALIAALATVSSAYLGTKVTNLEENSPGSIKSGQKLCLAKRKGQWIDSVIVPQSWSRDVCGFYT